MILVGTSVDEKTSHKMDVFLVDIDRRIPVSLQDARDGFEHTECRYFQMDDLPTPMPNGLKQIINNL